MHQPCLYVPFPLPYTIQPSDALELPLQFNPPDLSCPLTYQFPSVLSTFKPDTFCSLIMFQWFVIQAVAVPLIPVILSACEQSLAIFVFPDCVTSWVFFTCFTYKSHLTKQFNLLGQMNDIKYVCKIPHLWTETTAISFVFCLVEYNQSLQTKGFLPF